MALGAVGRRARRKATRKARGNRGKERPGLALLRSWCEHRPSVFVCLFRWATENVPYVIALQTSYCTVDSQEGGGGEWHGWMVGWMDGQRRVLGGWSSRVFANIKTRRQTQPPHHQDREDRKQSTKVDKNRAHHWFPKLPGWVERTKRTGQLARVWQDRGRNRLWSIWSFFSLSRRGRAWIRRQTSGAQCRLSPHPSHQILVLACLFSWSSSSSSLIPHPHPPVQSSPVQLSPPSNPSLIPATRACTLEPAINIEHSSFSRLVHQTLRQPCWNEGPSTEWVQSGPLPGLDEVSAAMCTVLYTVCSRFEPLLQPCVVWLAFGCPVLHTVQSYSVHSPYVVRGITGGDISCLDNTRRHEGQLLSRNIERLTILHKTPETTQMHMCTCHSELQLRSTHILVCLQAHQLYPHNLTRPHQTTPDPLYPSYPPCPFPLASRPAHPLANPSLQCPPSLPSQSSLALSGVGCVVIVDAETRKQDIHNARASNSTA